MQASALLALEGGAIFATLTANADTGLLAHAPDPARVLELIGVISLLCAVATAVAALVPRLGRTTDHRANHRQHTIYFGHLRHWQPDQLAARLRTAGHDDPFPMLARQLIEMSHRNWAKHRHIQISIALPLAGIILITLAAVISAV